MTKKNPIWNVISYMQFGGLVLFCLTLVGLGLAVSTTTLDGAKALAPIYMLLLVVAAISMIGAVASRSLETDDNAQLRRQFLIYLHCIALIFAEFSYFYGGYSSDAYVVISFLLNLSMIFTLMRFGLESLMLRAPLPEISAAITTGVPFAIFGVFFLYNNWHHNTELVCYLTITRLATIGLLLPIVATILLVQSVRGSSRHEITQLLKERLFNTRLNAVGLTGFYAIIICDLVILPLAIWGAGAGTSAFSHLWAYNFCPEFAVFMITYYRRRRYLNQFDIEQSFIASSGSFCLKRFARRNYERKAHIPWAATMSMRTANFVIDHDPNNETATKLTTTLSQIRKDEIQVHLEKIVGSRLLSFNAIDNKFYGTIDPEHSQRCCVDVLLFFACVYMDVGPLVERRLKVLTSLLPILDPALARIVSPSAVSASFSKMAWSFYLEYGWVDQCLINNVGRSNYLVHNEDLKITGRQQILNYLQHKNRIGNFIWIGENAHSRIIQEAPHLANTIESVPVPIGNIFDTKTTQESTIYLIRFEKMIPHLQKYYNLEDTRLILRDFEERLDTRKFLNILNIQLMSANDENAIGSILENLASYEFFGFKEKDSALSMALTIYERAVKNNKDIEMSPLFKKTLLTTIKNIGYPSQILHMAYLRKRSLRDIQSILQFCLESKNQRFHESWVMLATIDPRDLRVEDMTQIFNMIKTAIETPKIANHAIVQQKCMEVLVNVAARQISPQHAPALEDLLDHIAGYLIRITASADQIAFFLDAKMFLQDQSKVTLSLKPKTLQRVNKYIDGLRKKLGASSSAFLTVESRLGFLTSAHAQSVHKNMVTPEENSSKTAVG